MSSSRELNELFDDLRKIQKQISEEAKEKLGFEMKCVSTRTPKGMFFGGFVLLYIKPTKKHPFGGAGVYVSCVF